VRCGLEIRDTADWKSALLSRPDSTIIRCAPLTPRQTPRLPGPWRDDKVSLVRAFVFGWFAGLAFALPAFGSSVIIRVLPNNLRDVPLSVTAREGGLGNRITILYRTNATTLNEFLSASLAVADEDERIAECQIQKEWITDGHARFHGLLVLSEGFSYQ